MGIERIGGVLEIFRIYSQNLLICWMWDESAKMILRFLFNLTAIKSIIPLSVGVMN